MNWRLISNAHCAGIITTQNWVRRIPMNTSQIKSQKAQTVIKMVIQLYYMIHFCIAHAIAHQEGKFWFYISYSSAKYYICIISREITLEYLVSSPDLIDGGLISITPKVQWGHIPMFMAINVISTAIYIEVVPSTWHYIKHKCLIFHNSTAFTMAITPVQ